MSRQVKGVIALLVSGIALIFGLKYVRPLLEEREQKKTSDARELKGAVTLAVDNWIGYFPLCSKQMKKWMRGGGYNLKCVDDGGDYSARFKKLKNGELDFAVATVDSYLLNGAREKFPGTIIMVIDESKGGDALVARKDRIASLNELKTKDVRIAYTPNSPSEHFLKSLSVHFGVPGLAADQRRLVKTQGSAEALKKLLDSTVDAAVLWEPDVSRALANKAMVKLIGTDDTSSLIVDILVVAREFSKDKPQVVHMLVSNYFRTLKEFRDKPEILEKEIASTTKLDKEQISNMLKGVRWITLHENAEKWFGISLAGQTGFEGLVDAITSTLNILIESKDFTSNPLPDEDPYRIINSSFIEKLFVHGISTQPGTEKEDEGAGTFANSLEKKFTPLDDSAWNTLKEVGTLKILPIAFMSGTSDLSLEGKEELDKLVAHLKHYPNFRVIIKGHTGIRGDQEANRTLSKERADAVKQYLAVTYTIDENRLRAVGIGADEPLPKQPDESDRAYSYRLPRVELHLVREVY